MSKFRISLEVQALKLEIEGSREDAPMIAHNIAQQFAGLIQPAAHIVEGEVIEDSATPAASAPVTSGNGGPQRRRPARRRRPQPAASAHGDGNPHAALDWIHDAAAWGSPSQDWNTANKAIWLLYVAEQATTNTELTARCIANTFNKHFKQARTIHASHVARDLGKLKVGRDAAVGENTTAQPSRWFLTEAGRREAQRLISALPGVPASV